MKLDWALKRSSTFDHWSVAGLICICFVLFLLVVIPGLAVHDVQRVGQILIGGLIVFGGLSDRRITFSRGVLCFAIGPVLFLGAVSSFISDHVLWAMTELSVLVLVLGSVDYFAKMRRSSGVEADKIFFIFLILVCAAKCVQFLSSSAAAFLSGEKTIDLDMLIVGFSNKRFYGQFQTFTIPLLALPLLLSTTNRSLKFWISALLVCWWVIAISGGTRGTWLGMACAVICLSFCGSAARRWMMLQVTAATAGLLLFWFFFSWMPDYLGIEVLNAAGDRLNSSLSARDILWRQAWEMIQRHPMLGFGPMHFADIYNLVAAHPHQAILQWASEWGVPSTLFVVGLAAYGLLVTLRIIRKKAVSNNPVDLLRVCLFASLLGALTQSMVDGVIVMPYSQLWLAIVVGWLMGIHEWSDRFEPAGKNLLLAWKLVAAVSVAFLIYVVARDLPHLSQREDQYVHDFGGRLQPRFWAQGVIAERPSSLLEPLNTASFPAVTPK